MLPRASVRTESRPALLQPPGGAILKPGSQRSEARDLKSESRTDRSPDGARQPQRAALPVAKSVRVPSQSASNSSPPRHRERGAGREGAPPDVSVSHQFRVTPVNDGVRIGSCPAIAEAGRFWNRRAQSSRSSSDQISSHLCFLRGLLFKRILCRVPHPFESRPNHWVTRSPGQIPSETI
jgi:hypothetical protein